MKKTRQLSYKELLDILDAHDSKDKFDKPGSVPGCGELKEALRTAFDLKRLDDQSADSLDEQSLESSDDQAVLGIDVYQYSQFEALPQSLIPFIVRLLYSEVCHQVFSECPYLWHDTNEEELRKHFIDAGDGGYQLLDTPIHAVLFALSFETILRTLNSFRFYPRLRRLLPRDLSVRYAITYRNVFTFEHNYYGPGIIDNARIMERDRLNRCLIDQGTFDWFTRNIRGVENLGSIGLQDLQLLPDFQGYDASLAQKEGQVFPCKGGFPLLGSWKDIDVLKIGAVSVKNRPLSVYSLHVHFTCTMADEKDSTKNETFTVSLGNLNTSGISDL